MKTREERVTRAILLAKSHMASGAVETLINSFDTELIESKELIVKVSEVITNSLASFDDEDIHDIKEDVLDILEIYDRISTRHYARRFQSDMESGLKMITDDLDTDHLESNRPQYEADMLAVVTQSLASMLK